MGKWGWFSADQDTGEVVAKTEVDDNGSVNRYPYTKPDDIKAGHGHEHYANMQDFINGKTDRKARDKDDPESINRSWKGNGYDLALETLNNLSLEELQQLLTFINESYIHTNEDMLVKSVHKRLILK